MKTIMSKMTILMVLFMTAAFVACSDDDDEKEGKVDASSSKHIVRELYKYDSNYKNEVIEYEYDSQGRVVKRDRHEWGTTTYEYGDNTIITKCVYNSGAKLVSTYFLSNGLITDLEESYYDRYGDFSSTFREKYTYDSNGCLMTLSNYDHKTDFTWSDGNIVNYGLTFNSSYAKEDPRSHPISYTDIRWPKNFQFYWQEGHMDPVFEPLGLYGKMPKYLPSKIEQVGGEDERYYYYNYTVENGLITKVECQYKESYESGISTRIFEWE